MRVIVEAQKATNLVINDYYSFPIIKIDSKILQNKSFWLIASVIVINVLLVNSTSQISSHFNEQKVISLVVAEYYLRIYEHNIMVCDNCMYENDIRQCELNGAFSQNIVTKNLIKSLF